VYLLAAVPGGNKFPNLHIVGIFSTRAKALETLRTTPRTHAFILYEAPIDRFLGFVDKSGRLLDGMGRLHHEHFLPDDPIPVT
jgi:hypothetical protein